MEEEGDDDEEVELEVVTPPLVPLAEVVVCAAFCVGFVEVVLPAFFVLVLDVF